MPTLIATVQGTTSNSYITVADADTYFDERIGSSAWTGEDADDKARALIQATRRIDQEKYQGTKVTEGQALKWPRFWATDDDGEEFAEDAIPVIVRQATCELALQYLTDDDSGTVPLLDTGLEQFDTAKVGSLDMSRDPSFKAGQLPANVRRLLRPVLETASNTVRMGTSY
jgi:hypothetical protein